MSTFDVIVHSNVNIFEYFDLVKIPTEVTTRWRDRIVDHCIQLAFSLENEHSAECNDAIRAFLKGDSTIAALYRACCATVHGYYTADMLPAAVSRRAGLLPGEHGLVGAVNAAIRCMYDASRCASGANSTELTGADSCDMIRGWLMEELEKYTGEEHVAV